MGCAPGVRGTFRDQSSSEPVAPARTHCIPQNAHSTRWLSVWDNGLCCRKQDTATPVPASAPAPGPGPFDDGWVVDGGIRLVSSTFIIGHHAHRGAADRLPLRAARPRARSRHDSITSPETRLDGLRRRLGGVGARGSPPAQCLPHLAPRGGGSAHRRLALGAPLRGGALGPAWVRRRLPERLRSDTGRGRWEQMVERSLRCRGMSPDVVAEWLHSVRRWAAVYTHMS